MQVSGKHHWHHDNCRAVATVTSFLGRAQVLLGSLGDFLIYTTAGFLHLVVCPILRRTLITFSLSASNWVTRTCTVSAARGG